MNAASNLIERKHDVMMGKPVLKGTRITVELIVRKMADGFSLEDILAMYPHLTKEQIQAALVYAADAIVHEVVIESV